VEAHIIHLFGIAKCLLATTDRLSGKTINLKRHRNGHGHKG